MTLSSPFQAVAQTYSCFQRVTLASWRHGRGSLWKKIQWPSTQACVLLRCFSFGGRMSFLPANTLKCRASNTELGVFQTHWSLAIRTANTYRAITMGSPFAEPSTHGPLSPPNTPWGKYCYFLLINISESSKAKRFYVCYSLYLSGGTYYYFPIFCVSALSILLPQEHSGLAHPDCSTVQETKYLLNRMVVTISYPFRIATQLFFSVHFLYHYLLHKIRIRKHFFPIPIRGHIFVNFWKGLSTSKFPFNCKIIENSRNSR